MTVRVNTFIHGRPAYRVVAPCVVAELVGGTTRYVYQHGLLPADASPTQLEHLVDAGMVEEVAR